jgi:hypothetical protein
MAELDDTLIELASWLDLQAIPYMVIGSFAVDIWGEPRFTRHVDVTVSVPPDRLRARIEDISERFSVLAADPFTFVNETRVLPILVKTVSVDLVFAGLPYEEQAIERARTINLKGGPVRICSPEDLILHKIASGRPRDQEDIVGVFRYRRRELDYSYLDPRVEELSEAFADRNMLDWYRALRERW